MDYKYWSNFVEKIKPFIAIIVLVLISLSCFGLYKYNKLQEDIKDGCNYEPNEKVFCVCDKNIIEKIDLPNNPYYNNSLEINFSLGDNNS